MVPPSRRTTPALVGLSAGSPSSPSGDPPFAGSFAELKERQLVFLLVRQLAEAQFVRGDRAASERLWQEAAALEIDPERIVALLYGTADLSDTEAMERIDREHRCAAPSRSRGWFGAFSAPDLRSRSRGAWHRTAPPAAPRARREAR